MTGPLISFVFDLIAIFPCTFESVFLQGSDMLNREDVKTNKHWAGFVQALELRRANVRDQEPYLITNDVVVVTKILRDCALFTADKYQIVASATAIDTCVISTTKQIE